ncbi:MAG: RNB domain-containing ribonuclease [Lachnospiraceae bacterium]|nr:RNB domain-containing ribonuclease [Lachnospiraceae bacterium]
MEQREKRKKTILQLINDKNYKPLKQKELAFLLQVAPEDRDEFRELLSELVGEGRVLLTKRGKYQSLNDITRTGEFSGHQKGFGFVSVEGEDEDYFIPEQSTSGALHGDKVLIRVTEFSPFPGRRKEAEIIRVIERANEEVVGYFQKRKSFGFVIPDNHKLGGDIYIPKNKSMDAMTGHKVVVRLTSYGDKDHKPEGEVIEVLGHVNDPGTDILSIIRAFGLPMEFPDEVMTETSKISDTVTKEDIKGRLDLRDVLMVTIDGEEAKDLDDAVSLEISEKGYRLGVHIADVSHYVRENSSLDKEALSRGTSVYLADRVIPMLPHKLSNGICSLNAGEDRLALSCIMDIDDTGKVIGHEIRETVICVDKRMTYDGVFRILCEQGLIPEEELVNTGDATGDVTDNHAAGVKTNAREAGIDISGEYAEYVPMLSNMLKLSQLIRARRRERGSIDFDFPEAELRLSGDGRPVEIGVRDRNAAHKLIEDFMLAANETIAEDYYWQELPFEFRVHDKPDTEKLNKLKDMIGKMGYYFKTSRDDIHPKELQKLLHRIEGADEEDFINRIVLRSMQQARYSTACSGHFGLAARYYCHFTSPIRRYPDLQIHRIIKDNIHGRLTDNRISHYNNILTEVAELNSKRERRAQEAERQVMRLKKVQYMSRRIGEEFDGIISGVTGYGVYVELPNTVEGMVRMASIPNDYYIFDEENMLVYGRDLGVTYQLGQQVRVRVVMTDMKLLTIDFEFVDGSI